MNVETKNAVVMACDSNYAPYALFLASQIASLHPNRNFDICIFTQEEIQIPAGLNTLGVKVELIPGENPFSNGPHASRHGDATYLRLVIPPLVQGRYKRILYLDSDIFLCFPGIDQLFEVDMLGSPIAAVRDNIQWRTPSRLAPEFKELGLSYSPYFNAGVLLIDIDLYQAQDILGQCLTLLKKNREALRRHDQTLLNLVMRGRWTELSPLWNWQYTWSSRFFADLAEPRLIHFIGPRKPWKDSSNELPARFRSGYVNFLKAHYPSRADAVQINSDALGWPPGIGKTFFKHLVSAAPMKRYLDRFKNCLDVYKAN